MADLETVSEMRNPTADSVPASSPFSARSAYVHVPFCRSRCRYCAFYSGESLDLRDAYLRGMEAEVHAWGAGGGTLDTLYVGGGTPPTLGAAGLGRIVDALARVRGIARDAELTVEVNPAQGLRPAALRSVGFTRVSVGVQALNDGWLARLGRGHGAKDALACLEACRRAGFASVSADLILGLPGLDPAAAADWAEGCVAAGADHLSVYLLEIHPGTPLALDAAAERFRPPSAGKTVAQWEAVAERLERLGLAAYEVSNFARPGCRCRHNQRYWDQQAYRGLGPGAHSFDPEAGPWGTRWENLPDLGAWARALAAGRAPPQRVDRRTRDGAVLETLFLWARRPVPWPAVALEALGMEASRAAPLLADLQAAGDLSPEGRPTRQGMLRADGIARWLWERLKSRPAA